MEKLALDWPTVTDGREYRLLEYTSSSRNSGPALAAAWPPSVGRISRPIPDPRHVCIVTETYPPEINGVSMTLARLVSGLLERGHELSLVHPGRRSSDPPDQPCNLTDIKVPGLPIPCYRGLQFGLPAGGLLRDAWTRRRPEVVYVATEGPLGWSAAGTARRLGIPVLSGFHTNFHAYSRHYGLGWLHSVLLRYLRAFHNQTTGTLVAGTELRVRLEALGFRNVSVLGRGVDNRLFTPARRSPELRRSWGLREDDLAILHVGRLAPEKNLRLAIEAFRAIKRHAAAKFILVGDGPLRVALQGEHPDLIFTGQKTGTELAAYYASGDVFVFPSETETFGNVTLEAMASGLAVIAYDYAAARIHIVNGERGVLVPYGQAAAFIDACAGLACDREGIARLRLQARRYAAGVEWRQVVERFAVLLTGACGKPVGGDHAGSDPIAQTGRM